MCIYNFLLQSFMNGIALKISFYNTVWYTYVLTGLLDLSENYCPYSILGIFVSHNIWKRGGRGEGEGEGKGEGKGRGGEDFIFSSLVYFEMLTMKFNLYVLLYQLGF